jgi:lysozyme family protein
VDNNRFEAAFTWLIVDEGTSYTNDPADRGGPTRYGITQRSLGEWLGRPASAADVEALTLDAAKAFYLEQYWTPLRCDSIESPLKAVALFDLSVLVGRRAGVVLAQMASCAKVDGELGPNTLRCINAATDTAFICAMASHAANRFVRLALADTTQTRFLPGWVKRALRILDLLVT